MPPWKGCYGEAACYLLCSVSSPKSRRRLLQAAKSDVKSGESPGPARPCRQAWLLQAVCQDKAHSVGSGILPAGVVVVLGDSLRETPGFWKTAQGLLEYPSNGLLLSRYISAWGQRKQGRARAAPLTRTGATLVESCSHLELSQIGLCFEDGGPCGLVSYLPEVCVYMGHLASAPKGKDRWSLSS